MEKEKKRKKGHNTEAAAPGNFLEKKQCLIYTLDGYSYYNHKGQKP